jgi:peptide/nickel transport system permease protein
MVLLDALLAGQWSVFTEALQYAILPAFVLALPSLAAILRVNRAEMIEVLGSDYVTAARAHGVPAWRVIGWLALKNAMLPTLAMIGLRFGWTLGSTALVIGITFMLTNLLIDLAYGWLDPRTKSA